MNQYLDYETVLRPEFEDDQQSPQHESARQGPSTSIVGLPSSGLSEHTAWHWARSTKSGIPTRNYFEEITILIFIPCVLLLVLSALLSIVLCLHHEKMTDPESDEYFDELFNIFLMKEQPVSEKREPTPVEGVGNNGIQMVQYAMPERGTLKSLSAQPSSPNDSLSRSPRISGERCNPYIRPNPPPYTGPTNFASLRADF